MVFIKYCTNNLTLTIGIGIEMAREITGIRSVISAMKMIGVKVRSYEDSLLNLVIRVM